MRIKQNNFFSLLSGIKQYQIPIYQRNYAWKKEDCKRLLEDIVKAGTPGNPSHYIGSVIVKDEPSTGGINIFNVIDGQQRMTTITLLLLALKEYWSVNKQPNIPTKTAANLKNIKDKYLTNRALSKTSLFTKLLPKAGADRDEYDNLLHGVVGKGTISEIFSFFVQELQNNAYNPVVISDGINNAPLALVVLDTNDNPQLLFEAVNDTGVDLTNVDLVRNWLFMGLPGAEQDRLYRAYWEPIEKTLLKDIDVFLFYYTELKSASTIPGNFYKSFKKTFILNAGNTSLIEALLKEMKDYADLFAKYRSNGFAEQKVQTILNNIQHTGKFVFTPLILKILNQWNGRSISTGDVIKMLSFLESYIVRRDLLGIPTNSLGRVMKSLLNHSDSLADFISCINNLPAKQQMPEDTELQTQLQLKDFYNLRDSYYYLERIEKSLNPAFALTDPTIEHILPETMHTNNSPKPGVSNVDDYNWEIDLGPNAQAIHDKYQHTLGNLTILPRGENARMGDYRFNIKKTWAKAATGGFNYGYAFTPIRISQSLGCYSKWDGNAILARCAEMVKHICNVWPHP